MSTLSPTSTTTAATLGQAAEQAAAANNAAAAAAAASSSGSASAAASALGTNALQSLGTNFTSFLSLLTTQLQNQDPTSPMDTNQFTQELVEFTGVQQSVTTNTNLSQLISLTQGSEVLQSSNIIGDSATVTSPQIALQSGTGTVTFTTAAAEPVQIAIVDSAGNPILDASVNATAGSNSWTWNGQNNQGSQVPDGAYGIALETGTNGSNAAPVTFSVVGTASGLTNTPSGMQLDIGALQVPMTSVQSLNHGQ
jgi:flagellar basal-body rod modification protein FlgD